MRSYIVLFLIILSFSSKAQVTSDNLKTLKIQEDSLSYYSHEMVFDSFAENRFHYDSVFIRTLVKSLKTPYSFEFPFDSLVTISLTAALKFLPGSLNVMKVITGRKVQFK